MLHYTLANRPRSLWGNLWSEAFEVLSEEAECVHLRVDMQSLSPTKLKTLLYHSTYLSFLYPAKPFSTELKKNKKNEKKERGKK